jgi:hypothetical protein
MRRAVSAWSAKSPSATETFFSAGPTTAPARRGRISRIEKSKDAKTTKLHFHKSRKCKNKRLETFDFTNFALQFARMRVAFDERVGCRRSLIGTMLHH